jgi:hypothetical protein
LGTLNEYQARLFVADKALDQGRGGNYPLIGVDGDVAHATITKAVAALNTGKKLSVAELGRIREGGVDGKRWKRLTRDCRHS